MCLSCAPQVATDLKWDWPAVVLPYDPVALRLLPEAEIGHTRNGYSGLETSPHSKLPVEAALSYEGPEGSHMNSRGSPFMAALSCSFGSRHMCRNFKPGAETLV